MDLLISSESLLALVSIREFIFVFFTNRKSMLDYEVLTIQKSVTVKLLCLQEYLDTTVFKNTKSIWYSEGKDTGGYNNYILHFSFNVLFQLFGVTAGLSF